MIAMPQVLATEIEVDPVVQTDGSRWVREVHTLDDGEVREFPYFCDPAHDPEEIATGRAAAINEELAATEPDPQPTDEYLG